MKIEHPLLDSLHARSKFAGIKTTDGWKHHMWNVELFRNGITVSLSYKTGMLAAYDLESVLYSLLMDAQSGEKTFQDFCGNQGYNTDSRKAFSLWKKCKKAAEKLKMLYNREEIETLRELFADF